jgi:hypothetical protein
MLDRQLAAHGQTIRLQRLTLGPSGTQIPYEVTVKAFVRGYEPDELVGGITQQDSRVILSPSSLAGTDWPGPGEQQVPRKGDRAYIDGRARNVEAGKAIPLNDTVVRIEFTARG